MYSGRCHYVRQSADVCPHGRAAARGYGRSYHTYSEYFSEYFENFNPLLNKKVFKFKNNKLRQEIFHNIGVLQRENECKKYKITGPFSIGKSITLFVYSRFNNNVI